MRHLGARVALALTLTCAMSGVAAVAQDVAVDAAEEATAKTYFEQFNACSAAIRANKHDAETVLICRHAADTAATFAQDRRFIEKRAADVYAATALANSGDFVGALRYAD